MNIKKIVFVCMDEYYISTIECKMAEIINNNVDIEFITDIEYLKVFKSTPNKIDILIISETMKDEDFSMLNIGDIYYLTEDDSDDKKKSRNTIYKFGSVRYLLEKIGDELVFESDFEGKKGTKVISTYSATGGCGKTLISLAIAHELQKDGNRVLYINTQSIQDFHYYLKTQEYLSDDFVYAISVNKKNAQKVISGEIKTRGFDYIPPFRRLPVTCQIDLDVYTDIVEYLKTMNNYDYIIVELSDELTTAKVQFMQKCDKTLIVTTQNQTAVIKLEKFLNNMPHFNDKAVIICNRFVDNQKDHIAKSSALGAYQISEYIAECDTVLEYDEIKDKMMFNKTTLCLE